MHHDRAASTSTTTASKSSPLRVALHWDCELVHRGLSSMLEPHTDRIALVDIDSVLSGRVDADVLLLDPAPSSDRQVSPRTFAEVTPAIVLYTWEDPTAVADLADMPGVTGFLSKGASAGEVVDTLEKCGVRSDTGTAARAVGLTPREREVLDLVAKGMTNQEIAEATFVSINTIKTYIRAAYAKIGVRSRSQAVAWTLRNLG